MFDDDWRYCRLRTFCPTNDYCHSCWDSLCFRTCVDFRVGEPITQRNGEKSYSIIAATSAGLPDQFHILDRTTGSSRQPWSNGLKPDEAEDGHDHCCLDNHYRIAHIHVLHLHTQCSPSEPGQNRRHYKPNLKKMVNIWQWIKAFRLFGLVFNLTSLSLLALEDRLLWW